MANGAIKNRSFIRKTKVDYVTLESLQLVGGTLTCDAVSGYVPFGIVGQFVSGQCGVTSSSLNPNNGIISYTIKNFSSSSGTVTVSFDILYKSI